jgi:Xaa-Pro aminopeptidase
MAARDWPCLPAGELSERRGRILEAIGPDALAVVPGAGVPRRSVAFRQSNDFYYLTGIETPGAYVVLDAATGATTLYLPHRDPLEKEPPGVVLWAEDADTAALTSGVDFVAGVERLPVDLAKTLFRRPQQTVFLPHSPAETAAASRDALLDGTARRVADPLDSEETREARLARGIADRFPQARIEDLSPILDGLRLLKSDAELARLREAARLCGLGIMEAMRSTAAGVFEYELAAVASFVFLAGGAAGGAYQAIVASGPNGWYGHYSANDRRLEEGDLVLMDFAPDYAYYTSDIGRMWPVGGRYSAWQQELYGFILDYHDTLLSLIGPGVTPENVLSRAAETMAARVETTSWSKPEYERAARSALEFRGHLSHPVGMAVHDVGSYRGRPLEPGLVFSVDPMLWVPEEQLYVRVEDTVAVTADGVENLTGFVPRDLAEVEHLLTEPGLLQRWRSPP